MKLFQKIIVLLSFISVVSCSWLDVDPEGEATDEKLFLTGDGYRSVLSGVYKAMTSNNLYGVELQFGLIDCMSQQYEWGSWYYSMGGKPKYQEIKDFSYTNTNVRATVDAIWADGYNVIANANKLIQNIDKESDEIFASGEIERKMILGEAYACRALMHFDLCRLFAPAPIENESGSFLPYVEDYPNIQPKSIDTKTFLDNVIRDLKRAQELTMAFDTTALGQSVSASSRSRYDAQLEYGMTGYQSESSLDDFFLGRGYRLSYYAITALLARVYLYVEDYTNANECAKQVLEAKARKIDGGTIDMFKNEDFYGLQRGKLEDLQDLKIKSNLIFALYNEDAYNDYGLESFFRKKVSDQNVGNWLVIDKENQEIFKRVADGVDESDSDFRAKYLLFTPDYGGFWRQQSISAKWYCSDNEATRKKNVQILPVIRTSELNYLIAECYARNNKFTEAYDILNMLRMNRGLYTPLEGKSTLTDFLNDMVRDAQREYISEGQLFYLYKRLKFDVKIGDNKRKMTKSEYMLPIPINQNM